MALSNGSKMFLWVEKLLWILDVKERRVNICFSSDSGWQNIMKFWYSQETYRSGIVILFSRILNSEGPRGMVKASEGKM